MKNCDALQLTDYLLPSSFGPFYLLDIFFLIYFLSIQDETSYVFKAFKLSIYQQKDVTNWML